jgi:membrane protein
MSSSATVFIATRLTYFAERISLLGVLGPVIFVIVKILPYCVVWIMFTFIYIFMPNTKVNFKSGLLAGIIAGTIYVFVQWAYIAFQVGVAKYNAIYGSFAALPLFLVWLQMSWLIVLFGAEISFAHQNVETYEFEPDCLKVSYAFKRLVSLRIANLLVKNFSAGEKPLTAAAISGILDMPIRLVREILYELMGAGIVSETKAENYKEIAYQPARETSDLTIQSVVVALENKGVDSIPLARTAELERLSDSLKEFSERFEKSSANRLIKDI